MAIDPSAAFRKALREHKGRRGRLADPAWANRRLFLRGAHILSRRGWVRLEHVLRTHELGAACGIKEQVRRLPVTSTLTDAHEATIFLGHYVQVADMPESDRLWDTICAWWTDIEVLVVTGVTNPPKAANISIKNIKRTRRSFRNEKNYRTRILLASAARTAA